ncbi:hypothetical protein C349_04478 [Cryptococcus neoformans var. grubii Br795]|uniref:Uncharacterized protein n=1 Tax=Cryptococcus neoformans Tu259-1 TaxID=1230072 RepID=A0A854QAF5_CRYNE|nr:hypothetical protein C353_04447 [Cryptococcus neoformans var. grubii AD1-83a]OWZ53052.1 hypothetical protein C368_04620 [Cryptococcus neoformans var. grubii 125.91]OXG17760.1 hypothetical protein C361_04754 [Cryptococcus neoformans var. grubii Tu259-1]OXG39248.1 hypothetical protein C359_04156 [Cryptococcus neoformans var. grubii Bt120]OXG48307.1 hypothetical protein C355_04253 [Cryptococcus neoformans var. grubii Th84]OXG55662.1 hypothetical protein C354_04381 [Cryptococcus neoformans var.
MASRKLSSSSSQSQSNFISPVLPIAIFLDDSLIPSLPPPGGKLEHLDLMGRPKMPPPLKSIIVQPNSELSSKPTARSGHKMTSKQLDPQRLVPGPETRRAGSLGNRAGIGSAQMTSLPTTGRIASFEYPKNSGTRAKHGRTASDPTVEKVRRAAKVKIEDLRKPERSTSLVGTADGLKLGRPGDTKVVKFLTTIQALIPANRMPKPVPPPPITCVLTPMCFLTPMAIILETLVWEREMLKGNKAKTTLPMLRDGSQLQVSRKDGPGEVDWKIAQSYILAFGALLDSILPFLQDPLSSSDKRKVEELVKSARQYVAKMKKVFGEVARMYVDSYGFVRGWWDESWIKSAAGEVGRWGDLFDV